jgi:hypothetical protein
MKPSLPLPIEYFLSDDVLRCIYSFVPHLPKPKKTKSPLFCSISPNMERDLRLIQCSTLRGKNEMYLRDLEDFMLDQRAFQTGTF